MKGKGLNKLRGRRKGRDGRKDGKKSKARVIFSLEKYAQISKLSIFDVVLPKAELSALHIRFVGPT